MSAALDVLIPTYNRHGALAVTLAGLAAQDARDFRIVISDQSERPVTLADEVAAAIRILETHGQRVVLHRHLPRRGLAEQRQFLLDLVEAPYALYLDDDVFLEPYMVSMLLSVIRRERCGFVGTPLIGLSYRNDVRPRQQQVDFWDGPVQPEVVAPGSPEWDRALLHRAANPLHVQTRLSLTPDRPQTYRVAWVGGCVLFDVRALRTTGGFNFWRDLPMNHVGEDVLAQLRVMARFGGCGVLPSGAYHLELPTTVPDRTVDAPKVLR